VSERHVRAVRGATTVEADAPDGIREATRTLLAELLARNGLGPDDVVSALFTMTEDLSTEFPARAARELGWHDVPLLCMRELAVSGALPRCIRVLLHVETHRRRDEIRHVYLAGARVLRPDLPAG
jgi:chorismate mutase